MLFFPWTCCHKQVEGDIGLKANEKNRWIYSISTQYTVGSFGRQTSWLALLCVALPPFFLMSLIPNGVGESKGGPQKDDYEALPMVDTTRASGDEGSGDEDTRGSRLSRLQE